MDKTSAERVAEWWEAVWPSHFSATTHDKARELLIALFNAHAADARADASRGRQSNPGGAEMSPMDLTAKCDAAARAAIDAVGKSDLPPAILVGVLLGAAAALAVASGVSRDQAVAELQGCLADIGSEK